MPVDFHVFLEIPGESAKAGMQHFCCLGRPPDHVRPRRPEIGGTKEGVEPADVIDVEVRKEKMVNSLDLGEPEGVDTSLAAIEEESMDALARGEANEQRVIAARKPEYVILNAHRKMPASE
jgi:hypothetical protein